MKSVIDRLRRSMLLADGGGLTDGELLEQFIVRRDEVAFEALVQFHGPLVFGVCRRVLGNHHDAEEALQATFLVLARKAASIAPRDMVGNWLYGVAYRTALKAKVMRAKQRKREKQCKVLPESPSMTDDAAAELVPFLDRELDGLPSKYRAPVVLCDLEGKTHAEAARQLGWPSGTLSVRLMRGRALLARRLSRRGLALSVGSLAALLSESSASAAVPVEMAATIAQAALLPGAANAAAAGLVSQNVVLLTEGVLNSMFYNHLKSVVIGSLAVALLGLGVGSALVNAFAAQTVDKKPKNRAGNEEAAAPEKGKPVVLKYHDGKADGKKSLGGSGEMIKFTLPEEGSKLTGIRVHGSRYGQVSPPDESFLVYVLNDDCTQVVHTELAPYSLFKRGEEQFVAVNFRKPIEVPQEFWLALDFRPHQTKGVYVSFDKSSEGKHSRTGLPGYKGHDVEFGGDWMIEALLSK